MKNCIIKISLTLMILTMLIVPELNAQSGWSYYADPNVFRVEEMHFSGATLYCRSYYSGTSKNQKNDYFICKFDADQFTPLCGNSTGFPAILDNKYIFTPKRFAVTSEGSIYALFDNSIYLCKNSKWSLFYQDTIANDTLLDLKTIHRDCFDNVWVIQEKKVIYQQGGNKIYQGVGGRLIKIKNENLSVMIDTTYDNSTILSDYNLASAFLLTSDSQGNIISAETIFLFVYDQFKNTFKTYPISTLYQTSLKQPLNLYIGKSDRIWIIFKNNSACSGGLISVFDKGNWIYISADEGLSDSLANSSLGYSTDLLPARDGSIWTASNWGALRLKNKSAELIYPKNILPAAYTDAEFNPGVTCFAEAENGDVYMGAYPALFKYSAGTNIDEMSSEDIVIYPNPASDYIYLNKGLQPLVPGEQIKIYNSLGECVVTVRARHAVPLQKIDVSGLPAGVYFVRCGNVMGRFVKM